MKKSLITLATVATLVAAGAQVTQADTASLTDLAKSVVAKKAESTASVLNKAFVEAQLAYTLATDGGTNNNGVAVLGVKGAKSALTLKERELETANKALTQANTDKATAVKATTEAEDKKVATAEEAVTNLNKKVAEFKSYIAEQEEAKKQANLVTGITSSQRTQTIAAADAAIENAEASIKSLEEQIVTAKEAVETAKEARTAAVKATTDEQDKKVAEKQAVVDKATKEVEKAKTAVTEWTTVSAQLKVELEDAKLALIKNGLTDSQIQKLVAEAQAQVQAETVAVTRLYDPATGNHWFTTDAARVSTLRANGWSVEGVSFNTPKTGTAVYVVTSPNGYFHFTSNSEEIAGLEKLGWKKGEVVFYAASEGVSVHRVYNSNSGTHHFTSNVEEIKGLVALGWTDEGHAYYVAK